MDFRSTDSHWADKAVIQNNFHSFIYFLEKTKLILPNKSTSKATDVQNFKNQDSSRSKVQNKWLQFCFLFHFQWLLISLMSRKRLLLQESFYFRLLWLKTMVKLILRRSHSTVKCWETLVAIFINDLRECSLRRNLSQPLKIIFICGKTPSNYSSSERKCLCIVIQENMIRNKF